jgi:hypothetical protein
MFVVNTTKEPVSRKSCMRTTVARRIREVALRAHGWSQNETPLSSKHTEGVQWQKVPTERVPEAFPA